MTMTPSPTDSVLHNCDLDDKDTVRWDVTNDVIDAITAGETEISWVVKKKRERKWGKVVYYSKEGAAAEGDTDLAPKLIFE